MDIYVNARFLTQKITGVQRYAIELSKQLKVLTSSFNFTFLAPKNILHTQLAETFDVHQVGRLQGHAWEQFELPYYTRGKWLINLGNTAPVLKTKQIAVIHDASVFATPEAFSKSFRYLYRSLIPATARSAKKIITPSHFTKNELIRYCHINPEKIEVIYSGSEHLLGYNADTSILEKANLKEKPFVLSVSSLDPRKNFKAIVDAIPFMKGADIDIVIVGGTNSQLFRESSQHLTNVKYLGYVSNEELRALYEHSAAYVFTSIYEGFGFTPLEAMHFGCPVIVSNTASLPEVCGNAALYCDPFDSAGIANTIQRLALDKTLQDQLRKKGLERARLFTWEKCAQETLSVIHNLLSKMGV